jgi:hypothetical protein
MKAITVFASGVNEAREIRGFALAGFPIGASASNLRETAIQELLRVEGPVFLDSGAFSEVRYSPESGKLEVSNPISPREWRRRLSVYVRLARVLGSRLSVGAPDRVGDQDETLRRLALYRDELHVLHELGAHILIPLQVGARTHETFYAMAQEAVGVPLVPAFTMKKAVTSDGDAERFLKAVQPSRIHLLGIGRENRRAGHILDLIRRCSPSTEISMDSNRLRAVTGKKRSMTIMEHAFRESEIDNLFNEVESPVLATLGYRIDYTDLIAAPSAWATEEMLREIALASGFTLSETHAFFADPDGFLGRAITGADSYYWENPMVAMALDRAWGKYVQQQVHSHVRTAAIRETFQRDAA